MTFDLRKCGVFQLVNVVDNGRDNQSGGWQCGIRQCAHSLSHDRVRPFINSDISLGKPSASDNCANQTGIYIRRCAIIRKSAPKYPSENIPSRPTWVWPFEYTFYTPSFNNPTYIHSHLSGSDFEPERLTPFDSLFSFFRFNIQSRPFILFQLLDTLLSPPPPLFHIHPHLFRSDLGPLSLAHFRLDLRHILWKTTAFIYLRALL